MSLQHAVSAYVYYTALCIFEAITLVALKTKRRVENACLKKLSQNKTFPIIENTLLLNLRGWTLNSAVMNSQRTTFKNNFALNDYFVMKMFPIL